MDNRVSMMRMLSFRCSRASRGPPSLCPRLPALELILMKNLRNRKNGNSGRALIGNVATALFKIGKGTNMADPTRSLFFASGYVTAEQAGIHSFLFDE